MRKNRRQGRISLIIPRGTSVLANLRLQFCFVKKQLMFRTMIRQGVKEPVEFAGITPYRAGVAARVVMAMPSLIR